MVRIATRNNVMLDALLAGVSLFEASTEFTDAIYAPALIRNAGPQREANKALCARRRTLTDQCVETCDIDSNLPAPTSAPTTG